MCGPVVGEKQVRTAVEGDIPINSQQLADFILKIKQDSPLLGAKLDHLFLEKVDKDTITLALPLDRAFLLSKLQSKQTVTELKRQATNFWKRELNFQFQLAQKKK